MRRRYLSLGLVVIMIAGIGLSACGQEPIPEKTEPAELIDQGDGRNLVILTEKAARRLGIQTDMVREQQIMLTRTVGGEVTEIGTFNEAMVMVSLSAEELPKVDPSVPARVLPLDLDDPEDSDHGTAGFAAELDELPGLDDSENGAEVNLYYAVKDPEHGLVEGQRLIVELSLMRDEGARLVVPVGALLYDVHGEAWIYVSPEPLHFLRYAVQVDYIQHDMVVLLEGPPAGTEVATVGVAELYGTDTGVGK